MRSATAAGTLQLDFGIQALQLGGTTQPAVAGQTWFFQLWHRDGPAPLASNFTNALAVTFL